MSNDDEGLYEVESIVDTRTVRGKVQYRVRWASYSPSHDTWEPVENLSTCDDLIENYLSECKKKAAPYTSNSNNGVRRGEKKFPTDFSSHDGDKTPNILEVSFDCTEENCLSPSNAHGTSQKAKKLNISKNSSHNSPVQNSSPNLQTTDSQNSAPSHTSAGSPAVKNLNNGTQVDDEFLVQDQFEPLVRFLRKRQISLNPQNSPTKRRRRTKKSSTQSNSNDSACNEFLNTSTSSKNSSDQSNEENYIDLKPGNDPTVDSIEKEISQFDQLLAEVRRSNVGEAPKNSESGQIRNPGEKSKNIDDYLAKIQCDSVTGSSPHGPMLQDAGVVPKSIDNPPSTCNLIDLAVDSILKRVLHDTPEISTVRDTPTPQPGLNFSCKNLGEAGGSIGAVSLQKNFNFTTNELIAAKSRNSIDLIPKINETSELLPVNSANDANLLLKNTALGESEHFLVKQSDNCDASKIDKERSHFDSSHENHCPSQSVSDQRTTTPRLSPSHSTAFSDHPISTLSLSAEQPFPAALPSSAPRALKPLFGSWLPLLSKQAAQQGGKFDQIKIVDELQIIETMTLHPLERIAPLSDESSISSSSCKFSELENSQDSHHCVGMLNTTISSVQEETTTAEPSQAILKENSTTESHTSAAVPCFSKITPPQQSYDASHGILPIDMQNIAIEAPTPEKSTEVATPVSVKKVYIDGLTLELEISLILNDFFKLNMQQNMTDDRAENHLMARADFYEACRLGHFDIARSALCAARNAKFVYDVNLLLENGNTLLMLIVMNKCDSWHSFDDILELLAQNQANLNICNQNGDSALMLAIEGEHLCKVSKLLVLGAAVNLPNRGGETPLMVASKKGFNGVVSRLLEFGADFNATTNSGSTAASLAANQSIVKILHAHERKVKQAFDLSLEAILSPDKLRVGQILFPLHSYALNESKLFRLMFVHSTASMAAVSWSNQIVLVVAVARFGIQTVYTRLWGYSPVQRVQLNSRDQTPVQDDGRFLFSFSPLKNGVNELLIHCSDDHKLSDCKLLIQAFVVNRK